MPAILTSTLSNHRRSLNRAPRLTHHYRKNSSGFEYSDESFNISYRSCRQTIAEEGSTTSSILSGYHSSNSSFLSQCSSHNQQNFERLGEEWGYFVDVGAKDQEIERYSRVLTSRNKSRNGSIGLVRQILNLEHVLNNEI